MTPPIHPSRRHWITAMALAGWASPGRTQSNSVAIGMVRPLSGPLKEVAQGYLETVRATVNVVNAQGGIQGTRLDLVALDDVGDPKRTLEQARALVANPNVVAVAGIAGTGNVIGAAPVLQAGGLALVGPFTGSELLHDVTKYRNIFHIRASYRDEIDVLGETIVARHARGHVVVFYQDDTFGQGAHTTLGHYVARTAPSMKVSAFKFDRNTGRVTNPQAASLALQSADGVLLLAAPRAAVQLLEMTRQQRSSATVYTLSVVDALALVKGAGAKAAAGTLISQVVPNPKKSPIPLVREYRHLAETSQLPLSYAGLEGYISIRVIIEALRRTKAPITRDKVMATLEEFGKVDLAGFALQFTHKSHSGSKFVDTAMISPTGSIID
jgi:branched-chain amino acid transport system substrate-binding protein